MFRTRIPRPVLFPVHCHQQRGLARLVPLLFAALLVVVLLLGGRTGLFAGAEKRISGPAPASNLPAAANSNDNSAAQQTRVLERLAALGFENVSLAPGHLPGWYAVSTHQGLYYMDVNGEFLVAGQWFSVTNPEAVVNLTEQASAQMRVTELSQQDSAITYGASDARYRVSVFTDHTCGYCRRMHQMLDEYLAADIAIDYYAFPRAGMQSQSAAQLASIWCAEDRQAALNSAKMEGDTSTLDSPDEACTAQVADHLQMGRAMGVQGTPAIILPDGRLLTGFRTADALVAEFE